MIQEDHIDLVAKQIDVMDEKDTSETTQLDYVTASKGSLEPREDMQNGKILSHSHKEESVKASTTKRASRLINNNAKTWRAR